MSFRWDVILRTVATFGLLALLAVKTDWPDVFGIFARANWRILLLVALLSPSVVLGLAGRLFWLLRLRSFAVSFRTTWRATWAGQFFNLCLPGSTGGDLVRVLELSRGDRESMGRITALILVDRVFALLGLLALALWAVIWGGFPLFQWAPKLNFEKIAFIGLVGAGLSGTFWWGVRSGFLLRKFPQLKRIARSLSDLWLEVSTCMRLPRVILVGFLLALFVHFLNFSLIFLLSRALNLPFGYWEVIALMPVLFLVLMAPVTISGHGLREFFLISYCSWLTSVGISNLTDEHAIAFSVALVLADLVSSTPGGLWYLLQRRQDPVLRHTH